MKTIFATLAILISSLALGQSETRDVEYSDKNYKLEDVSISIKVNSKEDLEEINIEKLETFFEDLGENEPFSIELICEAEGMSLDEKSAFKIKVTGNSNDKKTILKRLKKLKKTAIKFYKSNK